MTLTPEQALENLARVAEQALLNGPDRRAINESLHLLSVQTTTVRNLTAENAALRAPASRPAPDPGADAP